MTPRKTPCTTLTFSPVRPRRLWTIDALSASPTPFAGAPAARGSAERRAPGGGCCHSIPQPFASCPTCKRWPRLSCVGSGKCHGARKMHDTLHHMSLFGLFLLPCSLSPSFALFALSHMRRCIATCGAPAPFSIPRLALAPPPCVLAVSRLPLPPSLRARCTAKCVASLVPLFAPPRCFCPLGLLLLGCPTLALLCPFSARHSAGHYA